MLISNSFIISIILISNLFSIHTHFNPSELTCEDAVCYSQTLFNPLLAKTNKSRCTINDDCINTFLFQINQDTNSISDQDKMMILVCSKFNIVAKIELSLNLNGELLHSSLSFAFNLLECLTCQLDLIEKFDSWKERDNICSAFKIRINQPFSKNKEILYMNRVGYYLTVNTIDLKSNDSLHKSRTNSFIYPQLLNDQFRSCETENCLFFRSQNVNEQCLKANDCTGRIMIFNLDEDNDRFVSVQFR